MSCYHPITAWWFREEGPDGKRPPLRFTPPVLSSMDKYECIDVPCGKCIGCRMDHARQWALRCQQEASLHDKNCMLTLTYNNDNLPSDGELDPRAFTLFVKRLRKAIEPTVIKFFGCGEYGTRNDRPHYHLCIFGWSPDDLLFWQTTKAGSKIYRSTIVERLWPYGFSSVGEVNWESAAYVARYNLKKQDNSYDNHKVKPFVRMSRRPGIGSDYAKEHLEEIYARDACSIHKVKHGIIVSSVDCKPPRYYDKLLEVENPERLEAVKEKRLVERKPIMYEYLHDSEIIKESQNTSFLRRDL